MPCRLLQHVLVQWECWLLLGKSGFHLQAQKVQGGWMPHPMIQGLRSSWSAQAAITKYHRLHSLNNRILFSYGSEDWKVQDQGASQCGLCCCLGCFVFWCDLGWEGEGVFVFLVGLVSGESFLPGLQMERHLPFLRRPQSYQIRALPL